MSNMGLEKATDNAERIRDGIPGQSLNSELLSEKKGSDILI